MTTTDLHPVFKWACGRENAQYTLDHPFVDGGCVCATNNYVAVRQPIDEPDTHPASSDAKYPPVSSLPWDRGLYESNPLQWPDAASLSAPVVKIGEHRECDLCEERLGNDTMCEECGEFAGIVTIEDFSREYEAWLWDGLVLDERYARPLMDWGAKLYRRLNEPKSSAAYFTIGDRITGLVMPMDACGDRTVREVLL